MKTRIKTMKRINKKLLIALYLGLFTLLSNAYALEAEIQVISTDKTKLALAYDDNVIRLYSIESGKLLQEFESHKDGIQTLNFNTDGTKLISGDWGNYAIIWDVKTGKVLNKKNMGETVMHANFSADNKSIILGVDEKKLAVYDTDIKNRLNTFEMGNSLQFSENKQFIAGTGRGDTVVVVDSTSQKHIVTIPADAYDDSIYFSDDNQTLVIRDWSDFHVWDIKNNKKIDTINSSIGADSATLNSSANELWIASNNSLEVWNYKTKKQKAIIRLQELDIDKIQHLDFSKDGKTLAITVTTESNGNKVILLDSKSYTIKTLLNPLSKTVYSTQFIDNNRLLLESRYPIEVWDIESKKKLFSFTKTGSDTKLTMKDIIKMDAKPYSVEGRINGLDVNPSGNIILTGTSSNANIEMDKNGKVIQVFQNKYSTGYDARYSPDGSLVAFAYHGEHLLVYDVKTNKLKKEYDLGGVPNGTRITKFSHDGRYLAAGSDGNYLSIIDVDAEEIIDQIKFPAGVFSLQWINNKKILVGTLLELYEFDLESKQQKTILESGVTALDAFYQNDKLKFIAVGGYEDQITILDENYNKTNKLLHSEVGRIAISKDGKKIVSSSESETLVWDLTTGRSKICAYEDDVIWAMAYDKKRHLIYTGGDSGMVNVWDEQCEELKE